MVGSLPNVITYAKFQGKIFRGYDFTGGWISHFPIDFWMGLTTVQRECAACDIYLNVTMDHARQFTMQTTADGIK